MARTVNHRGAVVKKLDGGDDSAYHDDMETAWTQKMEWHSAVDALFAQLAFVPVKRVVPAGAESTAFSPNAMKRNGWTPQPRTLWDVAVTLDGVDVTELVDPEGSLGRAFKSRKAAVELIESTVPLLATTWKECWAPESHDDEMLALLKLAH